MGGLWKRNLWYMWKLNNLKDAKKEEKNQTKKEFFIYCCYYFFCGFVCGQIEGEPQHRGKFSPW